jgi:hypothetical protein
LLRPIAQLDHCLDDAGNDVAMALDDDRVADPQISASPHPRVEELR